MCLYSYILLQFIYITKSSYTNMTLARKFMSILSELSGCAVYP